MAKQSKIIKSVLRGLLRLKPRNDKIYTELKLNIVNLTDKEQIITFYLIANFIIAICLLYLILSAIFRKVFKNEKRNKRKKDIVELFWEKDKESKSKTIFKRIFFIFLICLTSLYIFNAVRFITYNIDIVKKVLRIE